MEKNEFHVTVTFEGKEYPFDNGSEAYIFHTGILNDLNKIPGIELSQKAFRKFIAEIRGDINGDNYVKSFKWIN